MRLSVTRLGALVLGLVGIVEPAAAQSACETPARNDFANFAYFPVRTTVAQRNGALNVSVSSGSVIGDVDDWDSAFASIVSRRSDEARTARARVQVLGGWADAETYLFGYASAGLDLMMVARSGATVLCQDDIELYHAYYIDQGAPTLGIHTLECDLPDRFAGTEESIEIEVTLAAWYTRAGAASAEARADAQIIDVSLEGCSASCDGACGGSAGSCFCDSACVDFGDCCGDYAPECATDSCWESCGSSSPGGTCWCDAACTTFGDCCDDVEPACE